MRLKYTAAVAMSVACAASSLAVGTALAGDGGGWQYAGPAYCTDATPQCVEEAANSYLVAVRRHDGDHARLAPMVKRTRNAGEQTPETQWYTRDELADSLDESEDPVLSVHSVSWIIDGDEAIAFYAIDASYDEGEPQAAQTWLAERFHVTNGEIDEIEAIFFFAPGVGTTDRGWVSESRNGGQSADTVDPTWCTGTERSCVLDAAESTFTGQFIAGSPGARVSADVRRTLNGKDTALNDATAALLGWPTATTTYDIRDARWYVDDRTGDAVVFAALDQAIPVPGGAIGTTHAATIHLGQRMRVTAGLVHEIEQIAWVTQGSGPTPTGWEG